MNESRELMPRRDFLVHSAVSTAVITAAPIGAAAPISNSATARQKGPTAMKIKTAFPLFQVESPEKAAAFYMDHFGFEPIFESDWYVQIRNGSQELAFITIGHHSIPAERHGASENVCLTFEAEDVDGYYAKVKDHLDIKTDLCTEEWGQRHFLGIDPNGIMLDVMMMLPQPAAAE